MVTVVTGRYKALFILLSALSLMVVTASAWAHGCTPGFWKNHLEDWVGYSPGDDFDSTFGVDLFDPDITLEQALNLGGGGVNRLARHGTATLLSAAHPDVGSPATEAQVIALVQLGLTDRLEALNELGCPL